MKLFVAGFMGIGLWGAHGQETTASSEQNLKSLAEVIDLSGKHESRAEELAQLSPAEHGKQVFGKMAHYLDNQKAYYVELISTSTIKMGDSAKENVGISRVWLRRPDCLVWTTQSDLGGSALAIDGKNQTLFLPALSRYTVSKFGGNLDSSVVSMAAPYGILATALFSDNTSTTLHNALSGPPRWEGSQYVLGVPCDQLVVPVRGTGVRLWISQGAIPLPVRMVTLTEMAPMAGEKEGMRIITDVSFRWRVNMEISDNVFTLNLPDTAHKVEKLGGPLDLAKITGSKTASAKKGSTKGKSSDRGKSKSSEKKDFDLIYDAPPNLRGSSSLGGNDMSLPSLSGGKSGDDDIVSAAIRGGTKAKSVSGGTGYNPVENVPAPPPPSSAAKVPPISMNLLTGGGVDLNSYRGKVVVLDFWATWCGPCRKSLPILNQTAQNWRGRGVEFFAVNMGEEAGKVRDFSRQQGFSVPIALDLDGKLASMFGVGGIPHLVVIGKDGSVKGVHTGADSKLGELLNRDLETAIR